MSLYDSPVCPLADDLLLLSVADYAVEQTGLYAPENQGARHRLMERMINLASKRTFVDQRTQARSNNAAGPTVDDMHPPPSSFLTLATISIQLSMLRQLSKSDSSSDLALATCDGLLALLQHMPVSSLRTLSSWESGVVEQISGVMEELSLTSPKLRDSVKSLLLSFAVHKASMALLLKVLVSITQESKFALSAAAKDVVQRLVAVPCHSSLICNWVTAEITFPVRMASLDENEHEQRFIASSPDSSFLYLSTRKKLVRVGSGDSRALGSPQSVSGHLYASSDMGGCALMIRSRLFTAVRRRGSLNVDIFERDLFDLRLLNQGVPLFSLPFHDRGTVEAESTCILSSLGDDKGGRTVSWIGPSGWVSGPGVKCYFEVVICDDIGSLAVGWSMPGFAAADNLRIGGVGDAFCWCFDPITGEVVRNGSRSRWGLQFRRGDVLGCALEIDTSGDFAIVSFSKNGSWEMPMGRAALIQRNSEPLKFRGLYAYSSDETDTPLFLAGGLFRDDPENVVFRYGPPSPDFIALAQAMVPCSMPGSNHPFGDDTADSLPPMCTDGDVLYTVRMLSDDERSTRSSQPVIILGMYELDEKSNSFARTGEKHFKRAVDGTTTQIRSFQQPFSSWRMMSNGCSIFLAVVAVTNSGSGHYKSSAIHLDSLDTPEYAELPWAVGAEGLDIPQAVTYDSRVNVIWGWDEKLNIVYAFESISVGKPLRTALDLSSLDGDDSIKICGAVVSAASRLAAPYLLDVPLNHSRTRCSICDYPCLSVVGHRDLFLDPFDTSTMRSLSILAQRCLEKGNVEALKSLLSLIFVNLHVAFCVRSPQPAAAFHFEPDVVASLRSTLFAAIDYSELAFLARRTLCEGIPIFWSTIEEKLIFMKGPSRDAIVVHKVMRALNEQLALSLTFPSHRAFIDDATLSFLVDVIKTHEHPLVADSASSLIMGLLCSGFKFLRAAASDDGVSNASNAARPLSAMPSMLSTADEEESKEDEASSQNTRDNFGKTPTMYFDEVVSFIVFLFERSMDAGFVPPLSTKILPLALVILDMLIGDFVAGSPTTKAFLRVESQIQPTRIASLVLQVIKAIDVSSSKLSPTEFSFTRFEIVSRLVQSRDLVKGDHDQRLTVHIPFASRMSISFDPRSRVLSSKETLRFDRPTSNGDIEFVGSEKGFSTGNLPGLDIPPLTAATDRIECIYTNQSDDSDEVDERFAFTVIAQRIIKRKVQERHYLYHIFEGLKALLSNITMATVQSSAYVLVDRELELMRWIQNAVFSGGLRTMEDMPPRPTLKRGSRASVYSSGDMKAYLLEESESLLNELLENKVSLPSLAGGFVSGMRIPMNRVPFDQGKLTQPAVCAVAAALIRANGLETEALTFARSVIAAEGPVRAPPRLRTLWSAAQLVRAWCDSIVVNGRTQRHLEACGVKWIPPHPAEESKDEEVEPIDLEDAEYEALCQLVISRCEFLVRSVHPPPFLRLTRRREDALARWHFLRERFCPDTSRFVERDALGAVLRAIRAFVSVRRQSAVPSPSKVYQTLGPVDTSPQIDYTPLQSTPLQSTDRRLRKLVSSDDVLQPLSMRPNKASDQLTRRASLSSWGSSMKRKPSWLGIVETIDEIETNVLASPVSSVGGLRYRRGSVASVSTAGGVRVKSRAEGGLRRASLDGFLEEPDVVDVARQEHEQSLSESVLNFVETPSVIRKRDLISVFKMRNERAQARFTGIAIVVAIFQGTNFHSKYGREMFEFLLSLTMSAIRMCGTNSSVADQSIMEAHFMTDLAGCSVVWRERVTAIYLAFMRIVSHQTMRVARNFAVQPQRKAGDHLILLLENLTIDYVERDYSMLYRSDVIEALHAALSLPRSSRVPMQAWKVFETLFRRCVVDHVDKTSVIGHIFQQKLLDILVSAIRCSPVQDIGQDDGFMDVDENDDDESDQGVDVIVDSSKEQLNASPLTGSRALEPGQSGDLLHHEEIYLNHDDVRFVSRLVRLQGDFRLSFRIRSHRQVSGSLLPGGLVAFGGEPNRRWRWLDIGINQDLSICACLVASDGEIIAKLVSRPLIHEEANLDLDVCLTLRGNVLDLLCVNLTEQVGDHVSVEIEAPKVLARFFSFSENLPGVPETPRIRRLSSRSSIEPDDASILSGRLYVGCRPGLGLLACQGVQISRICLNSKQAMLATEFFKGLSSAPEPRAAEPLGGTLQRMSATRGYSATTFSRTLSALDLANAALRQGSTIATTRLATPSAQSTLLNLILDQTLPLRLRIQSARVMRHVLLNVLPSGAIISRLSKCVGRAMPPVSRPRETSTLNIVASPVTTTAIADEVVDLVHYLCEKQSSWASFIAEWLVHKVGELDRLPLEVKLYENEDIVRDACVALAFCGGKVEAVRVGGKASIIASPLQSAPTAQTLVRIVALDLLGETSIEDVTNQCSFYELNNPPGNPEAQTQLNRLTSSTDVKGGVFSTILIESPAPLRSVEVFVENHRLDSPRSVSVRVGTKQTRLGRPRKLEVPPREGWFTLFSCQENAIDRPDDAVSAILRPQEDIDDYTCCAIHIRSVWGFSPEFKISKIRVNSAIYKQAANKQGSFEERFICVPTADDENEDDEVDELDATIAPINLTGGPKTKEPSSPQERRFALYEESNLLPWPSTPPKRVVQSVAAVAGQDVFDAFHRLLSSMNKRIEGSKGPERRLALDLQVRIFKAVCTMLMSLGRAQRIPGSMATFLLRVMQAHNTKLNPVPVITRFRRTGVPEPWKVRLASVSSKEDSVRFEPLGSSAWVHRFVVGETELMETGIHSWVFTLIQDSARGDESVLFGICTERDAHRNFTNRGGSSSNSPTNHNGESNGGEDEELDLLLPSSRFRFLRAFDGSAIGAQPPSPMLCVRVGDSVRCELDLDKGTLSMAVNNRPLVCVFNDIVGPIWPCVGTYAERGTVVVTMSNLRCTPPHPKRRCANECRNLPDVQLEALASQAFQVLCVDGEDQTVENDERSLTFLGAAEDDDQEFNGAFRGDDETDSDLDEYADSAISKLGGKAENAATELLAHKSPVLYRVEDSTALSKSSINSTSPVNGAGNFVPQISGAPDPTLPPTALSPRAPHPGMIGAISGADSAKVVGFQLTSHQRYEALLWELLTRLSRRSFDAAVCNWFPGGVPEADFVEKGLEEAVKSLFRSGQDTSMELLKSINELVLRDFAVRGVVNLGTIVGQVKKTFRRPVRSQESSSS